MRSSLKAFQGLEGREVVADFSQHGSDLKARKCDARRGFDQTLPSLFPSGDDDGLSHSGEGRREEGRRSASPSDPVESLNALTRKIGAFVNKPSTQVKPRAQGRDTPVCTVAAPARPS